MRFKKYFRLGSEGVEHSTNNVPDKITLFVSCMWPCIGAIMTRVRWVQWLTLMQLSST